jgi:hypothetical protein
VRHIVLLLQTVKEMEAFVHNGDFDFNVFAHTPGPTIEPKPKVEKKRKDRDPIPTWEMRNRKNEYSKGGGPYDEDSYDTQHNAPPTKKLHLENEKHKYQNTQRDQYKQKPNTNQDNTDQPDSTKQIYNKKQTHDSKNNKDKKKATEQKWNFDAKEGWEPDETDIANTITVERGDSIFLGEFSDTGLSERLISTVVSKFSFLHLSIHLPFPLFPLSSLSSSSTLHSLSHLFLNIYIAMQIT